MEPKEYVRNYFREHDLDGLERVATEHGGIDIFVCTTVDRDKFIDPLVRLLKELQTEYPEICSECISFSINGSVYRTDGSFMVWDDVCEGFIPEEHQQIINEIESERGCVLTPEERVNAISILWYADIVVK